MNFRRATSADVSGIVEVQQAGALAGLAHIFPQDQHPFPGDVIADRWRAELADPSTFIYVAADESGRITGFAARREDQLLHFGTAVDRWGTGLAAELYDALLLTFPPVIKQVRLRVFSENVRARRFYERRDWRTTGVTPTTSFPPHPLLVEYARDLRDPGSRRRSSGQE